MFERLRVLERDNSQNPIVIIFCTTNCETIFEGIDMTHHNSLLTRFMRVKFDECDKEELIKYIMYYNQEFLGTNFHREHITEQYLRDRIRSDIKITQRD